MPRRFPAPWTAERIPGGYVVNDDTGRSLAYVCARETKAQADAAKVLRMNEARQVARKLIQGHIDPHYKVVNMQIFCSALVAVLKIARMRGEDDAGDVLTLT